jgi:toxin FitB
MIPEPQRTYVLELLKALGAAADGFVVAGAQAMKFMLSQARATKDIDFVLDAIALRGEKDSIAQTLKDLGYRVVPGSQNFQFEKAIPGSKEVMRIEFMAPEELKREKDFRVDVQNGIHARACTGGSIALAEFNIYEFSGKLPDGSAFSALIRVTKPHALVMLKLLALDDRYRNIRGPAEARHDREEARTHAADVIAVASVQADMKGFRQDFGDQFSADATLGLRVLRILDGYFRTSTSPGLLVYEEHLVGDRPLDRAARSEVAGELARAQQLILGLLPPTLFFQLLAGIEDCCDLTLGEIRKGITSYPDAARRVKIEAWLSRDLRQRFVGRILSLDENVADRWGVIIGLATTPIPVIDGLLAATAFEHNLTLVTRNTTDVSATGVPVFNPWTS